MRIISGTMKGRQFNAPLGHKTHPMGEKIRGALFNVLGDVSGLTVFDPYAGTGALSFEAISRGAKRATLIELDKEAQKIVQANIETLGLRDQTTFVAGKCERWSANNPTEQFDLMLCDPPYDRVLIGTIASLGRHVKPNAMLVLSWPQHVGVEEIPGFEMLKNSRYANALLVFYRKLS